MIKDIGPGDHTDILVVLFKAFFGGKSLVSVEVFDKFDMHITRSRVHEENTTNAGVGAGFATRLPSVTRIRAAEVVDKDALTR